MPTILPDEVMRRYQQIKDRLAQIDSASDEAATLRLERSELDEMAFPDDCSQYIPVRQRDDRCPWCGTQHWGGECQWVRRLAEELRREG